MTNPSQIACWPDLSWLPVPHHVMAAVSRVHAAEQLTFGQASRVTPFSVSHAVVLSSNGADGQ